MKKILALMVFMLMLTACSTNAFLDGKWCCKSLNEYWLFSEDGEFMECDTAGRNIYLGQYTVEDTEKVDGIEGRPKLIKIDLADEGQDGLLLDMDTHFEFYMTHTKDKMTLYDRDDMNTVLEFELEDEE